MMQKWLAFVLAWALILGGSLLASRVQTSSGAVTVSEVRIPTPEGVTVSGLLYAPKSATPQARAPAILASHGYINTREMQSPFAIELSRRGYVVLAMDMTGHGYSGGIVGTAGFGGPAALDYLRRLPMVDPDRIGLEGHSMGGGPVMAAALAQPEGYRAIVLEGSTPRLLGAPAPENPRNLAVVFGQFDEFAPLMWGVPKGSLVATSPKLQKVFGVAGPVQPGRLYGAIADGSARWLVNPPVTHPWEHFSGSGVGAAVDWFQQVIPPPAPRPPTAQVWFVKEIGTLLGFVGLIGLLLATFDLILDTPPFQRLANAPEPATERRGARWMIGLALTALIPALTYYPLMKVGQVIIPMPMAPQWIQNQLLAWALGTAVITLLLGFAMRTRTNFTNHWITAILAAVITVAVGYLSLALVDAVFKVDFRFWVLGLKPLSATRATIFPLYAVGWAMAFLISIRALLTHIPVRGETLLASIGWAKIAMAGGFLLLVVREYASLLLTGVLATPTEPLNAIVAIQFVPLLGALGAIAAFTYRRTNSYIPGALICALLVSWYVTSGTANHWAPGFAPQPPGAARAK